jgi:2-polyprenyl-3-methyl-5-hydroxy-6-metoxy-1,4-benzoquinol methylase
MMEKLSSCPACGETKLLPFLMAKDYTVTHENFEITRCQACELLFTNPRPTASEASPYYKSENYISHSDTQRGIINRLYHVVRNFTLKQKTRWIEKEKTGNLELLDIGCGNGHFLHACQKAGWKISGMELDPVTAARAETMLGIDIYSSIKNIPKSEKFNLISLWHVLEHVYELEEYFMFFKSQIAKEGVLLLALPNSKSFDAHHFKEYWAAYDVPRHVYHFEPSTIASLAKKHGFKLKSTRGQIFDSFYISLLSHEYKTGKKKLINSFVTGLWSNISAYFGKGNYSSNLYIFEHV